MRALALLVLASCGGSTGLEMVGYPLSARGGAAPFTAGGWEITVDEAQVGFGPLYLCASNAATAELCEPAVAEFAASATVDALAAQPQPLGEVRGFSGTVHSALYDYAFSWPGEAPPKAQPGAPGGHSVRSRVTARQGERVLHVLAELDLRPQQPATRTVQMRVPDQVQSSALRLELQFDPAAWWRDVDFEALSALGPEVTIPPADGAAPIAQARSVLITALTSAHRPAFVWNQP
jgi:hypothetical protein